MHLEFHYPPKFCLFPHFDLSSLWIKFRSKIVRFLLFMKNLFIVKLIFSANWRYKIKIKNKKQYGILSSNFWLLHILIWWLPRMKFGLVRSCSQLLTIRWKSALISSWLSPSQESEESQWAAFWNVEHSSAAQANILRNQFIPTTNGNNPVFYLYFYAVFECSTFCENAPVILDLSLPLLNGKVYNMHVFKCKKDRLSLKGSRWHVCDFERRKKDFSFPDSQAALSLHLHIYYSYPPQDHNVPEAMPAVLWHHTCKCAQQHKTFCPCC